MSIALRAILFGGAILTFIYMFYKIRNDKMLISHTVFWSLFSVGLVVLSAFPQIAGWASDLLGIDSPANFVFLVMIFLLIIKQFTSTVKVAHLDHQITELTEYIALKETSLRSNEPTTKED